MSFRGLFVLFVILTAFSVSFAQADDSSTENVSSTSVKTETGGSLYDSLYADMFTVYHGPVIDKIGSSSESVNNKGVYGPKSPMYFDNELTTAYLIDKESGIGVGPDVPFWLTPVQGQGLTLGDVGVKAIDKKFVDSGNLRIYTNIYLQLPTSQYSSDVRHVSYAVKTTPYWWYHIGGTRFTVGSWNEFKDYVGANDYTLKLYSMPYVNYQLTPKLSANVGYEMEAHHLDGSGSFNFTTYETDLQPGFDYWITPMVMVNPYVQLFTGNRVNSDTAALCAVISARLM